MILLDYLKQPDDGAVMFMRCDLCGITTILHNEHAVRPVDGTAWLVRGICDKIHWPPEKIEAPKNLFAFAPPRWSTF